MFGQSRTFQSTVGIVVVPQHPTAITPTTGSLIYTSPVGSPIATVAVTMSDGTRFNGSLSAVDGTGIVCGVSPCAVSNALVTARAMTNVDVGAHTLRLSATANGQTLTQPFTLTITPQATLSLAVTPSAPTTPSSAGTSGNVAALQGVWSDGTTFPAPPATGYIFVAPNYDVNGTYAVSGSELILNPNGPGVANAGGTVQHITMEAVQLATTADGVTSTAPSGPPLVNSAPSPGGYWSWSARRSGSDYILNLNGQSPNYAGILMEVAHGGQLYVNTTSSGWFLWNGTTFVGTAAP